MIAAATHFQSHEFTLNGVFPHPAQFPPNPAHFLPNPATFPIHSHFWATSPAKIPYHSHKIPTQPCTFPTQIPLLGKA